MQRKVKELFTSGSKMFQSTQRAPGGERSGVASLVESTTSNPGLGHGLQAQTVRHIFEYP